MEQLGRRRLRLAGLVHVQGGRRAELDRGVAGGGAAPLQHEAGHLLVPRAAAARPEEGALAGGGLAGLVTAAGHLAPLPLLRVCTAAGRLNTAARVHLPLAAVPDDVLQLLLTAVVVVVVKTSHKCW